MDRPRFTPSPCRARRSPALRSTLHDEQWLPIVCCPADFAVDLFGRAVEQLVHHPEYNSTLILRSEIISETRHSDGAPPSDLESHRPVHDIHRRILPRRPGRDAALDQHCTLYTSTNDGVACTLVLSPLLPPGASLPYYHPPVRRLAFRFIASSTPPILRIEVVLPSSPDPNLQQPSLDLDSRLYRTSLSLLETLHRYGWGATSNYQKRVAHDRIVPRDVYQDMYLVMRERYRGFVGTWKEATDPAKHVFEDIGIATYLILLWKQTFASAGDGGQGWPQPPGGFLDLGCGNGLLTHILVSEGYRGHGVDLRARTSWAHYPDRTRVALHVHALDPMRYAADARSSTPGPSASAVVPYLERGTFLIANHADELTPWTPLLATLERASGYLSIPCCAWSFDERFTGAGSGGAAGVGIDDPHGEDEEAFVAGLSLGNAGLLAKSRYSAYRIWLARTSRWTGWKVECDTLRIPSTRNWAIVGRERLDDDDGVYIDRALSVVWEVAKRGAFKTRTPEGKASDH